MFSSLIKQNPGRTVRSFAWCSRAKDILRYVPRPVKHNFGIHGNSSALHNSLARANRALRWNAGPKMEPTARVELATYRLQGGCSAIELRRRTSFFGIAAQKAGAYDTQMPPAPQGCERHLRFYTAVRRGGPGAASPFGTARPRCPPARRPSPPLPPSQRRAGADRRSST